MYSAHIPFLMFDPGGMCGFRKGSTVKQVVELREIMPTFLEAAGVPIPDSVDGCSLLPLCRGDSAAWRDYLHGEHAYGALSNHYVTDATHKYIWFSQSGEEQLFHLETVPQELHNLASDAQPEVLSIWRDRLVEELKRREEGYVSNARLVAGRTPKAFLSTAVPGSKAQ
ncbi:sulfatase/phosphatase domain-containing protein [Paenibacillus sp. SAF-054]|uniref:sulfatase/phosphatase domain-containing protein n=1 Tax=unclassified Paenibacillus TaxID=185978 RepID=UPI003F7FCFC5